jgi:hypothetical protein
MSDKHFNLVLLLAGILLSVLSLNILLSKITTPVGYGALIIYSFGTQLIAVGFRKTKE